MRVIVLTPHLDHPYITCLVRSLRGGQVDARIGRIRRFLQPLFAIAQHGWPAVFHVQWQHYLFVSESLTVSIVKSALWFLQWSVLRLLGIRFVWTVHNVVNHERINAGWEIRMCRLWSKCVDTMIVHCEAAAEEVAAAYDVAHTKIAVIPHGNFVDVYGPRIDSKRACASLELPTSGVRFLCFGQIKPYKGLDALLQLFETEDFGGRAHLLIAGSAPDAVLRERINALAARSNAVTANLHYIEDDYVPMYMGGCDAIVLPYMHSLTSGVAVLAASFGRPIVASRVGCLANWPHDAGIFYSHDDSYGLKRALEQALEADLVALGRRSYDFARTQLDWTDVARQTRATYVQVQCR